MPKKANRRPARTKGRPRRVETRANGAHPVADETNDAASTNEQVVTGTTAVMTAPAVAAAPTARRTTGSARRHAAPPRKVALTVINYAYLRRDLFYLAVLAPLMVILVVIAYFIWH